MNARTLILTIAAAALVAAPAAINAQQGTGNCDGTGPHGGAKMLGGPGGPGDGGGPDGHGLLRMLPRLAERIGLTETQQSQIQAIIEAQQPALDALRDQAQAARETFAESHEIGDYDADAYRTFFESQARLHVEMQLIGAATVDQVWDVLTPEQQTEVADLLDLLGGGFGGPRQGAGKRLGPR